MRPHLYAFLAGLAAACAFQPFGLWPLMPAAFGFLLHGLDRAASLRAALARGWWFGLGNFVLGLNWIATAFTYQSAMPAWLGWVAVVLLSLYLAVYPALACGLAWRHGRGDPLRLTLVLAAGWIATEWLRATMFTGFAWNPAGVALLPTFWARAATLVGTYGTSGLAVLLGGALWQLAGRRWRSGASLVAGACAVALAGLLASPPQRAPPGPAIRIVQPNIGQDVKWEEGVVAPTLERLGRLSAHDPATPRAVLWPESAVTRPLEVGLPDPYAQAETERLRRAVGRLVGPGDLLLTGSDTAQSEDGVRVTSATNSVFAMTREGRILARYDKAHLVPYGEYLPMRPLLSALGLSRLAPGDTDFVPGPGPRTFDLPIVGKVGFQLCYEIIFSGEVVDPKDRPAFLFNPSNDAWFGRWGPPQHLAQARMRALEEGLPVLRATPTGISAAVDADGRLAASLPWRTMGVIDARLPPPKRPTPFALLGNFAPFVFALLLGAVAIAVGRRTRYGRI
ncbi:MAG: apolipoprotein N-acyltransferase [Alphaproteobacteria bacterium]|nr:apolipoprotein N-acyltransferase [Alphaproteobacteria bacterium]MBV9370937.1 apolipoprotein N-acyltransferase [Alphaproteobacteria bacterium]MBV9901133.1 apolipoprotein N-acyltransferase [Alphaproteobacteria bacterium]